MRPIAWAIIGFLIVAVPTSLAQAHKAMQQLDRIDRERVLVAMDTQRVQSSLDAIGPREAQVREKQATLHVDGATASMTAIQGSFDQYLDTVARRDGIGYAPSTCDPDVTPAVRPGLEGLRCTITVTGTYTQLLDALQRITADAPVLVDAQKISVGRNDSADASQNPLLAADLTLYLERVAAPRPSVTTSATPNSTPSPGASGAPATPAT
jgi:hypothetical protein